MEHHDLAENEVGDKECCQILIFVWRREKKLRLPEFFYRTSERNNWAEHMWHAAGTFKDRYREREGKMHGTISNEDFYSNEFIA